MIIHSSDFILFFGLFNVTECSLYLSFIKKEQEFNFFLLVGVKKMDFSIVFNEY